MWCYPWEKYVTGNEDRKITWMQEVHVAPNFDNSAIRERQKVDGDYLI